MQQCINCIVRNGKRRKEVNEHKSGSGYDVMIAASVTPAAQHQKHQSERGQHAASTPPLETNWGNTAIRTNWVPASLLEGIGLRRASTREVRRRSLHHRLVHQ